MADQIWGLVRIYHCRMILLETRSLPGFFTHQVSRPSLKKATVRLHRLCIPFLTFELWPLCTDWHQCFVIEELKLVVPLMRHTHMFLETQETCFWHFLILIFVISIHSILSLHNKGFILFRFCLFLLLFLKIFYCAAVLHCCAHPNFYLKQPIHSFWGWRFIFLSAELRGFPVGAC